MTTDRPRVEIGIRELRDKFAAMVKRVREGDSLVVMSNTTPIAVMITYREAEFWDRVQFGLAALSGLEIYPEAARDTSELARMVSGQRRATDRELNELARQPHELLAVTASTVGVSEARKRMAELLETVSRGEPTALVSGGEMAAVLISPARYQRLRRLGLIVTWFKAAGLDLSEADVDEVLSWVRERRPKAAAVASDEGSAIA
jgi:prevent-host-death family protein